MSYRVCRNPRSYIRGGVSIPLHVYCRFYHLLNNTGVQEATEIHNIRFFIVKTGKVYRKTQTKRCSVRCGFQGSNEGEVQRPCTVSPAADECPVISFTGLVVIHLTAAPRQLGAERTFCCVPGAPLPQVEIQQHIISLETIKFGQELGHLFPTTGSPS